MHSHGPSSEFDLTQTSLYKNFQSGDLLYGLQAARARFLVCLTNKSDKPLTPDTYNNVILPRVALHKQNPSFSLCFSPKKGSHFAALQSAPVEKVRPDAPMSSGKAHFDKTKRLVSKDDRRIRRACKAALLRSDVTKHFMLDGIDLLEVFDREVSIRNKVAKASPISYDSFTSAELRFALRYFHLIKDRILFYRAGKSIHLFEGMSTSTIQALYSYLHKKEAWDALAAIEEYRKTLPSPSVSSQPAAGSPSKASSSHVRLFALVPNTPAAKRGKAKSRLGKHWNPSKKRGLFSARILDDRDSDSDSEAKRGKYELATENQFSHALDDSPPSSPTSSGSTTFAGPR